MSTINESNGHSATGTQRPREQGTRRPSLGRRWIATRCQPRLVSFSWGAVVPRAPRR